MKRAIAWGWTALLGAVLLAQTLARASRAGGIDLTSYLLSARALLHGASPYLLATPFPYLYPATLAFVLIPLTFVPGAVAVVVWFALNAAAAVWAVNAIVVRDERRRVQANEVAPFLAVFFTAFLPIVQSNLRNGQVNFVVLALSVAAGLVSWPLAIALKLVPLALAPYFALRRRWTWMLAAAALTAAFCLVPAVVVGSRIVDMYREYWRVFLASSLAPRVQPLDFSLAGTVASLARVPLTPVLRVSAAAVVIGWIMQADARRLRRETTRPLSLYLLAVPLVLPQSEVHHLAFILPAAAFVGWTLWVQRMRSSRTLLVAAVATAILYVAALAIPVAAGPLFCATMLALGVSVMQAGGESL